MSHVRKNSLKPQKQKNYKILFNYLIIDHLQTITRHHTMAYSTMFFITSQYQILKRIECSQFAMKQSCVTYYIMTKHFSHYWITPILTSYVFDTMPYTEVITRVFLPHTWCSTKASTLSSIPSQVNSNGKKGETWSMNIERNILALNMHMHREWPTLFATLCPTTEAGPNQERLVVRYVVVFELAIHISSLEVSS